MQRPIIQIRITVTGESQMPKAIWNGVVLAESEQTEHMEGNHYFPPDSVNWDVVKKSDTNTTCFWKGQANYYHIEVDGKVNQDAAWVYSEPSEAATRIKDHVAFWRGVKVEN